MTATIEQYLTDERETELSSFDHDVAWQLGSAIRRAAVAAGQGVVIDIRRPSGAVLFHCALAGATADNDDWARRKSAVVVRFEASSALIAARLGEAGIDATTGGWLDGADYAVTGGAVPVRVRGAGMVAVATVSGLSSQDDHDLVVGALREMAG